jgi:hypothetical protein
LGRLGNARPTRPPNGDWFVTRVFSHDGRRAA